MNQRSHSELQLANSSYSHCTGSAVCLVSVLSLLRLGLCSVSSFSSALRRLRLCSFSSLPRLRLSLVASDFNIISGFLYESVISRGCFALQAGEILLNCFYFFCFYGKFFLAKNVFLGPGGVITHFTLDYSGKIIELLYSFIEITDQGHLNTYKPVALNN